MHPFYLTLGFKKHDEPYISAFNHAARSAGWSQNKIDATIEWYAIEGKKLHGAELVEAFSRFAQSSDFTPEDLQTVFTWHDITKATGPQLPARPSAASDRQRRMQIEKIMKAKNSQYWQNPEMQRELHDILERAAVAASEQQEGIRSQPSAIDVRKAEIQKMLHERPGEYWESPVIQEEYLTLLGNESHPQLSAPTVGVENAAAGNGQNEG